MCALLMLKPEFFLFSLASKHGPILIMSIPVLQKRVPTIRSQCRNQTNTLLISLIFNIIQKIEAVSQNGTASLHRKCSEHFPVPRLIHPCPFDLFPGLFLI